MQTASLDGTIARREVGWAVFILALISYIIFSGRGILMAAAGVGVVVLISVLYIIYLLLQGNADPLMILWLGIFPFGYYYLAIPSPDHAIITWDRVVLGGILLAGFLAPAARSIKPPVQYLRAGLCWGGFIVAAVISLAKSIDPGGAAKLIFDSFLIPALFGWYVIRNFDFRRHGKAIHLILCLSVMVTCAIGIAEDVLQTDIMPYPGSATSGIVLDNASDSSMLLRGNGPFAAAHTFSLVGQISFFLLLFLRRAIPDMGLAQRLIHVLGASAALLQTVLPLGRAVYLSLVLIVVMDAFYVDSKLQKALRWSVIPLVILILIGIKIFVPGLFAERSKADNAIQRVAQQFQTVKIWADSPVLGVGLQNFVPMARSGRFDVDIEGFIPADAPHNNLGIIAAETGLLGAIFFVASQIYLVQSFVRFRKTRAGQLAWKYFLYLFVSYTFIGFTISQIYNREINVIYVFAMSLMLKYIITASREGQLEAGA